MSRACYHPHMIAPKFSIKSACILSVGLAFSTLAGCANSPDPYYNPPPLPPYGSNPSMNLGAVEPLAPPPAADGTY